MIEYVSLKGKKIKVKKGKLKINYKLIYEINEIKGLDSLVNLKELNLNKNFRISEIKGLEKLTNLNILRLRNNNISEIKGLETLTNLKLLDLAKNNISEIKGLESLTDLEYLDLTANKISEIKNLEALVNLQFLLIGRNQIPAKFLNSLGGLSQEGRVFYPQNFVEYSSEKKKQLIEKKMILSCPFCRCFIKTLDINGNTIICNNCGSKYEKQDLLKTEIL